MKPNRHMISFSFLFWATLLVSVVDPDLASDREAMVALRENVRGRLLYWNISSNPCNWTGVTCSSNRVVELRLPGMGLLGQLPVGNRFSGEIPAVLFTLKNLIRLNLANNNFSGPIPDSVSNLTRLVEWFDSKRLIKRKSGEKVDETRGRDAAPAQQPVVEIPGDNAAGESGSRSSGLSGVVKKEAKSSGVKNLVFFGKVSRVFDLEDLLRASAEVLGKGTFGTTYKATLEMGVVVAVKRLKDVTVSEKEFKEKMDVVGAMEHQNLVPLRGYYFSADEKLLVYDYMPMGSLSSLLHGNRGAGRTPLNWDTRSGVALGAARGIAYLHSKGPEISHGNVKSSNILLTTLYEARVSDFGLAQLAGPTSTPNRVDGYRAPEVTDARKVSQKADVYSFGILLLELLTGKAPTHALLNEEGIDLPRWVQSIVREDWTAEVFDLELLRYQTVEEDMSNSYSLPLIALSNIPKIVLRWPR
ncbi:RLK902 protein [Hibiscus syriacus]|uniref:RLK902 protein n=1 Tax=Hibiscus syriacus TaxID=106335 RepID=A0A6A2Y136_HIBSY|nr:RLK902 protein [Hibiscus syriacus]